MFLLKIRIKSIDFCGFIVKTDTIYHEEKLLVFKYFINNEKLETIKSL